MQVPQYPKSLLYTLYYPGNYTLVFYRNLRVLCIPEYSDYLILLQVYVHVITLVPLACADKVILIAMEFGIFQVSDDCKDHQLLLHSTLQVPVHTIIKYDKYTQFVLGVSEYHSIIQLYYIWKRCS